MPPTRAKGEEVTNVGKILIALYAWFLTIVEHKEFSKLPVVGKYFQRKNISG
jgi:hypothetical protein